MKPVVFAMAAALAAAGTSSAADFSLVEGGRPVAAFEIGATPDKSSAKGAANDVALFNKYLMQVTGCGILPADGQGGQCPNVIRIELKPIRDVGRRFEWSIDFPSANRMTVTATEKSLFNALRQLLEEGCDARFLGSEKCMFQYEPRKDVSVAAKPRRSAAKSFTLHRAVCHLLGREREMGLDNDHQFEFSHGIPVYAFPHTKYAKEGWPKFAMPVHGGRRIDGPDPRYYFGIWQPCYSNPDVAHLAASNILVHLRANPAKSALTLAVNDCGGYCECEECRAMDANAEKSIFSNDPENRSSSYYTFANRVIGEVEKEFPGIRYGALAYTGTVMPPPFPVNRKIVPMITMDTILASMDPETAARQDDIIRRWGEKVDEIGIWEYNWGRPFYVPRVDFAASAARLKFLYANGGRAYFSENNGDMLDGPKTYLVSRLIEDIERDPEAVLDEWYTRFAGAAAAPELKAIYAACTEYWHSDAMKRSPVYEQRHCILLNKATAQFFAIEPGFTGGLLERARKVRSLAKTPGERLRAETLVRHFEMLDAHVSFLGCAHVRPENGEFASAADAAAALNDLADRADALMDEWNRSTDYFRNADFDNPDAYVRRGSTLIAFDPVPLLAEQFGRAAMFAADPDVAAAFRRVASSASIPPRACAIAKNIASGGGANKFANPGLARPLSEMDVKTSLPCEITDEVEWHGEKTLKVFPGRPDGDPNPYDLLLRRTPTVILGENHKPGVWKVAVRVFAREKDRMADLSVWRRCDGKVRDWSNVAYVPLEAGKWTTLVKTIDLTDSSDGFTINLRLSENFGRDEPVYFGGIEVVKAGPPGASMRAGQATGDQIRPNNNGVRSEVLGERAVVSSRRGPFCRFYAPMPRIVPGEEVVFAVKAALPEGAKKGILGATASWTPNYDQAKSVVRGKSIRAGGYEVVEFSLTRETLGFHSGKICISLSNDGGDAVAVSSATWRIRPSVLKPFSVAAEHEPRSVMGRGYWTYLRTGVQCDPYYWNLESTRANPWFSEELTKVPFLRECALVNESERPPPDGNGTSAAWRTVRDNYGPKNSKWDAVVANAKSDRPLVVVFSGKRDVRAMVGDVDIDHDDWRRFKAAHPNLVGTRTMCEWGNDITLLTRRTNRIGNAARRSELEELFAKYSMSDRYDRVALCRWYTDRKLKLHYDDMDTFMAFRSAYYLDHMAAAWGAKTLTAETTNTTNEDSEYRWDVSCMFVRGAARQFGLPWCWYEACFFNGRRADGSWINNSVANNVRIRGGARPEGGMSPQAQRRAWFYAYLNGANAVESESWAYCFFTTNTPSGKAALSDRGRNFSGFHDFTAAHPDRGVAYAPVAILVPFAQGYTCTGGKAWFGCPYTAGDYALDAVFFSIAPGWKRAEGLKRGESEGNLHNSRLAMMYDVLVPDSPQGKDDFARALSRYPAAVIAGDYPNPEAFEGVLADYVRAGGRLVRIAQDMLPPFAGASAIQKIHRGELKFPKVEAELNALQRDLFPFEVSGDCQYGASRTASGWWLWVMNNKGVVKFADRFAQVDRGKDATIAVRCRLGSPTSVKELVTGTDVPTKGDTFDYTVPAGDLAVFSLDLPTLKQ